MSRRSARDIPPPLELECLSVLWRLGESNVRTVQEDLAASRRLAYTTVMTMLERLARKQLVSRRKAGRHFLYTAQVDRDTVRLNAVRNLVDSLFDASPAQLAAFLAAEAELSPARSARPVNGPDSEDDERGDSDFDAVLL
jgi:BlaI family transcriptional regulator, penicillinase repressor